MSLVWTVSKLLWGVVRSVTFIIDLFSLCVLFSHLRQHVYLKLCPIHQHPSAYIENTSWKVLAYGIYERVVDVSEIE